MSKAAGNGSDQGCRAAGDIWKQGLTSHWCKPHFSGSEGPSPSFILRDNVNIPNYTVAPEATLFASGSPAKQIRLMVTGHTRKQGGVLVCLWVLFKLARRNCSFLRTYFFFFSSAHSSQSPKPTCQWLARTCSHSGLFSSLPLLSFFPFWQMFIRGRISWVQALYWGAGWPQGTG